jgi:hypothetical protein
MPFQGPIKIPPWFMASIFLLHCKWVPGKVSYAVKKTLCTSMSSVLGSFAQSLPMVMPITHKLKGTLFMGFA